jgi:hypothetical protein
MKILPPLRGLIAMGANPGLTPGANFGQGSPAHQPPPFPSSSSAPRAKIAADFASESIFQETRSLLKYRGMLREVRMSHMARRERRASPSWGCKERATPPDGPFWPRPEGCAAFWGCAALLVGHRPMKSMLPPRALPSPKNRRNATYPYISAGSWSRLTKSVAAISVIL